MRSCHAAAAAHAAQHTPLARQPLIIARKSLKAESFLEVPHRFTLGLRPIDEEEWLASPPSSVQRAELGLKRALLDGTATRHTVLAALPGSEPAQSELLEHVQDWMHRFRPPGSTGDDAAELDRPAAAGSALALEQAARLVSEDLLLMERREGGDWVLTAACVCFPSRWSLAEKMGRSIEAIHEPVPGLNARLAPRINRLFEKLKPGQIVGRMNSDVMDSPDLYQPPEFGAELERAVALGETEPVHLDNAGERLHLRLERQTLRRLPESQAILFTVKTHQLRLKDVVEDLSLADRVRRHYASLMGSEMARYKRFVPILCQWLAPRVSCQAMSRDALGRVQLQKCGR